MPKVININSPNLQKQDSEALLSHNPGFLREVPDKDIPKMLFLSVDPNKAEQMERYISQKVLDSGDPLIQDSISRILDKYETALKEKSITPVRMELQVRLLKLSNLIVIDDDSLSTLESNFSDETDQLNEEEDDVLEFTEIFETLRHTLPKEIHQKFNNIVGNKKIPIRQHSDAKSENKAFFIYAENKVMAEICNKLSPQEVYDMYQVLRQSKDVESDNKISRALKQNIDLEALNKVSGLKDVAFYYLILSMIKKNILNRLYTHCISFTLQQVKQIVKERGQSYVHLDELLSTLNRYPVASRPPGICIIFCITEDRKGSDKDLMKIKELFEKFFKYDVLVKLNPDESEIKFIIGKLKAARNKFYDSLVVIFMGHGDKTTLKVRAGNIHRRRDLIQPFTEIKWFNKKPKLFFIQACAVKSDRKRMLSASDGASTQGLQTETDSLSWKAAAGPDWQKRYNVHTDMAVVNSFADTLISYATMWYQPASRSEQGSLYVDTLVDQLKEFGHTESIENVLRRVHYNTNTVSLQSEEEGLHVQWKQAPYFESSLQKEFIFPKYN